MILFLLIVFVILVLCPGLFLVIGFAFAPAFLAMLAFGIVIWVAVSIRVQREKHEDARRAQERENARMMPTLYGP